MKYINVIKGKIDSSYSLVLAEKSIPEPEKHEVLIKVAAAGVNRADIYQALGQYRSPQGSSEILGLEVSGEVIKLGSEVKKHSVGEKVCALVPGGGYSEYITVSEWRVLTVPKTIKLEETAAIPEAIFTCYLNLMELGAMKPGDKVLIHGGTSGVGTMAIQMAKQFGAKVIATAGSDEKCELCIKLGADVAINYKKDDFSEEVRDVNLILDMVGGDYFNKNLKVLAHFGRLLCIAFIKGNKVEATLAPILLKNLKVIGSTLRSKSEEEIYDLAESIRNSIWPMLENGKIKPVIDSVFSFEDAGKAHEKMRNFNHSGKILLKP